MADDYRFLIVDDFPMIRTLVANSLKNLGHKNLSEAEDGEKALEKISSAIDQGNPYNIVFLDWMMPVMTGLELVKACNRQEKLKTTNFVMITAEQDQKNIVEALSAGVKGYIIKPFSVGVLDQKIKSVLGGS